MLGTHHAKLFTLKIAPYRSSKILRVPVLNSEGSGHASHDNRTLCRVSLELYPSPASVRTHSVSKASCSSKVRSSKHDPAAPPSSRFLMTVGLRCRASSASTADWMAAPI